MFSEFNVIRRDMDKDFAKGDKLYVPEFAEKPFKTTFSVKNVAFIRPSEQVDGETLIGLDNYRVFNAVSGFEKTMKHMKHKETDVGAMMEIIAREQTEANRDFSKDKDSGLLVKTWQNTMRLAIQLAHIKLVEPDPENPKETTIWLQNNQTFHAVESYEKIISRMGNVVRRVPRLKTTATALDNGVAIV